LFAPIATAVVLAIVIGVWAIVDGVFDTVCYAFANALSEDEAKQLYETYAVPTPGKHSSKQEQPT
jgi:non-heme chloroperoxidase